MGNSVNPKTGKWTESIVTQVKYRKYNTKGRWQSFVVDGKMPSDHQKLVDRVIAKMAEKRPHG